MGYYIIFSVIYTTMSVLLFSGVIFYTAINEIIRYKRWRFKK